MVHRVGRYVRDHHLALLCLFLLIGGGTAWAAGLAPNSVKSKNIKDGQVKTDDLGNEAVSAQKIKDIGALGANTVIVNDPVVDGAAEVGDTIVFGEFSLVPACRQSPAGTFTATVTIQSDPGQMSVHSEAENGASNPAVASQAVATLIQVGPTTNSNVRSGSFGALTDNGAFISSVAGNVTAATEFLGVVDCAFGISATGD
jgi:hypothetical protein